MQHAHSFDALAVAAAVCAVGTFDGVHLGHQRLLEGVVEEARARGSAAIAVTFFPHPKVVFGRAPALYLTLPEEKAMILAEMGLDAVVSLPFDAVTMATSAADFIDQMRLKFGMRSLWMGQDFALGHNRQGTPDFLRESGKTHGFDVTIVPPVSVAGGLVSSTRVREAVLRGDLSEAAACLGRPFSVAADLINPRRARFPAEHALPPPDDYPIFACGGLNAGRLRTGPPAEISLATPVEDCAHLIVEFI